MDLCRAWCTRVHWALLGLKFIFLIFVYITSYCIPYACSYVKIGLKREKSMTSETYLRACAPPEDSDQPAHLRSLIRIFTGHVLGKQEEFFFLADNEDYNQTARMRRLI